MRRRLLKSRFPSLRSTALSLGDCEETSAPRNLPVAESEAEQGGRRLKEKGAERRSAQASSTRAKESKDCTPAVTAAARGQSPNS
jgi:hypothetical protein